MAIKNFKEQDPNEDMLTKINGMIVELNRWDTNAKNQQKFLASERFVMFHLLHKSLLNMMLLHKRAYLLQYDDLGSDDDQHDDQAEDWYNKSSLQVPTSQQENNLRQN